MDEVQRVGNVNAVELRAYERIADVFARLLAEPTPEALLGAFADAIEQLVPSSGLVLLERNEAEDELTPVLMRGTRNDDALRVPLVAHGRVTGALSIHREGDDSEFRDEELEFIARFADAAALVLDNARARARLAQLAQTDDLTGALNRRGFFEAAERELARATREDTHTALLVVDVDDLKGVKGVVVRSVSDRTFLMHLGGKVAMTGRVAVRNRDDLSLVYTPGVARVSRAIAADPERSWALTQRANAIAIISDGTAVLGLGNVGPLARRDLDRFIGGSRQSHKRQARFFGQQIRQRLPHRPIVVGDQDGDAGQHCPRDGGHRGSLRITA
jgi:hypothetical protein